MRALLLTALGGGIGAVLRYGMTLAIPSTTFPWAILATNFVGSGAIGSVMALTVEFEWLSDDGRLFWGVGVLGGYTTFSTYVAGVVAFAAAGRLSEAVVYAVGSLAAGILGVWTGLVAVRTLAQVEARTADTGDEEH